MTWTYSGDPKSTPRDEVRFRCGDTDEAIPLLSDEEIDFLLTLKVTPPRAAQEACLAILAKLAKEVDYSIGPESVKASQRYDAYKKFMATMQASQLDSVAAPSWDDGSYASSASVFDVGMHDNGGDRHG